MRWLRLGLLRCKELLSSLTRESEIGESPGLGAHVEGMLMAYLPKEKIVIEADLYDPPASDEHSPATANPVHKTFYNNVQQLGLMGLPCRGAIL